MTTLPMGKTPDDVVPRLIPLVRGLVDPASVVSFRFGRTRDLDAARDQHGMDSFHALYVTDKPHHAVLVEDALLQAFEADPRLDDNVAYDVDGPEDGRPCSVYIVARLSAR